MQRSFNFLIAKIKEDTFAMERFTAYQYLYLQSYQSKNACISNSLEILSSF